jgi:hypothetical protein
MPSPRRFPPPWTAEELVAAFVVKELAGRSCHTLFRRREWEKIGTRGVGVFPSRLLCHLAPTASQIEVRPSKHVIGY